MPTGSEDFDAFYTATAKRLVATVYAVTGDLAEAEDAVQEAYVRAWQRWDRLAREGIRCLGCGRWPYGWQSAPGEGRATAYGRTSGTGRPRRSPVSRWTGWRWSGRWAS